MLKHQAHPLMHQPLARMRMESVIAERRALKSSANHVVDIDDADKITRDTMDNQEAVVTVKAKGVQILPKLRFGSRLRRDPRTVQAAAAMNRGNKCRTIAQDWRSDYYSLMG